MMYDQTCYRVGLQVNRLVKSLISGISQYYNALLMSYNQGGQILLEFMETDMEKYIAISKQHVRKGFLCVWESSAKGASLCSKRCQQSTL